jgi:S1-C subfamily serine protease
MRTLICAALLALATSMSSCAPAYPDDHVVGVVRSLHPAVVLLTMRVPPEGKSKEKYDDAYATGMVVASGRWGSDILTVAHAVDGAWDLRVTVDNRQKFPARLIAMNRDLDVALVRTDKPHLVAVQLGSSAHLGDDLGREVGVLGYPIPDEFQDEGLGLATSLNTGRLSSLRKDALEVTPVIVPGESGGPIFLLDTGEIIGVAESRFDDEHSIGFALPIDDAKTFLHKQDAGHGF